MPTILQSVAMVVISGTTATRTFASACTPGSRIVAMATQENHTGTFTISDPTNGAYAVDSDGANDVAGNGTAATVRSVENTASTALTVTVTLGASGNGVFVVYELSDCVPDDASSGLGGVGSPTATPHTGSITTSAANAAVFSIGGHYPSGAVVDSGFTSAFAETGISISYHWGEYDIDVGAAGVKTLTYGFGNVENWSLAIASYIDGGASGPTVDTDPENKNVYTGESAAFAVGATTSGGALNYQWKFNGSNVGTNSDTYTRTGTVLGDDGGLIAVEVTDDNGTATSAAARLTVFEAVPGALFLVGDTIHHSYVGGVASVGGEEYDLTNSGDLTVTLGALTISAAGSVGVTGNLSATLGAITASAAGSASINGALTSTLGAATLSATGTALSGVIGNLSVTLGAITTSAAGSASITGALSSTLGAVTLTGAASAGVNGTLSTTLGTVTATASGTVGSAGVNGDLTVTLGAVTTSATGSASVNGTLNSTLGAVTTSAAGSASITGALSSTLGAVTLAGAGVAGNTATGNLSSTLGAVTTSAAGSAAIGGTFNQSLGAVSITGAGSIAVTGVMNVTLGAVTLFTGGLPDVWSGGNAVIGGRLIAAQTGRIGSTTLYGQQGRIGP